MFSGCCIVVTNWRAWFTTSFLAITSSDDILAVSSLSFPMISTAELCCVAIVIPLRGLFEQEGNEGNGDLVGRKKMCEGAGWST
ncbi:hypothetical protein F5Y08DRAFT_316693 [Xylaria arbuscula]|nr:hypothetical protein F5Y08DRAFT_316693 [Xylaria arbuscula]